MKATDEMEECNFDHERNVNNWCTEGREIVEDLKELLIDVPTSRLFHG
jgi:hypothetical protein